jgi:CubicO group peptidase (beta-lactamase class C family)
MPRLISSRVPVAVTLANRLCANVFKANGYRGVHGGKELKMDNLERLNEHSSRGRLSLQRLRLLVRTVLVAMALFCTVSFANAQDSLDAMLKPFLARYELPALAAAVVKDGSLIAVGAVGTRKAGAKVPVTVHDRFHLGSDTKAMTSLLAAMFVEAGKLRWDSTVAEVFPELVEKMDPGLGRVTIEQLLSHTSGIPSDNDVFGDLLERAMLQDGNLDELRYWLVQQWSTQPLESQPGTKFAYANMNYAIVGAIIERVSGQSWDELITERVFTPLGLQSAGLGPQSTLGRIDAPLGHVVISGRTKAFLAGPNGDNPLILGPAGIAHMSILDFARWAGWNAGGGKRAPKLVEAPTLKKLHTPVIAVPERKEASPGTPRSGRYALGWGELAVDWAPEPLIFHGGSNERNLAHIWLDPARDVAMVLVTNISGSKANEALYTLAPELYAKFAASRRGDGGGR